MVALHSQEENEILKEELDKEFNQIKDELQGSKSGWYEKGK